MLQIKVNGVEHSIDADPQMPLLWAVRDIVGLTGTNLAAASAPAAREPSISTSGGPVLPDDVGRRTRARDRHDRGPRRRGHASGLACLGGEQCSAILLLAGQIMRAVTLLKGTLTAQICLRLLEGSVLTIDNDVDLAIVGGHHQRRALGGSIGFVGLGRMGSAMRPISRSAAAG